jgi:excisionase family DNA binding protein
LSNIQAPTGHKMNEMEDRWLSITEICKYLGVSNDTVYKWIDKHNMPAHRMGRLWKFKKNEVDEWIKAGGAAVKAGDTHAK